MQKSKYFILSHVMNSMFSTDPTNIQTDGMQISEKGGKEIVKQNLFNWFSIGLSVLDYNCRL